MNGRIRALKQFGRWLEQTRRVQHDPFASLRPMNEAEDRRHVRRALAPEEASRLLEAARTRLLVEARVARIHAGVTDVEHARLTRLGRIRELVYALALWTGLRAGEIRRLRWQDVEGGLVRVPAASAKSRRDQAVPLSSSLQAMLEEARPPDATGRDLVVPAGSFPNSLTFHRDREAAGIPREDASGRVVDFHGLRTTFVSWLAMGGVHPRVAQALARHADVTTTMARYTDLALLDLRGAVESMPQPATRPAPKRRAGQ